MRVAARGRHRVTNPAASCSRSRKIDPHQTATYNQRAGWSSPVARWAHNPKVAGSNPAPATIYGNSIHSRSIQTGALERLFPFIPLRFQPAEATRQIYELNSSFATLLLARLWFSIGGPSIAAMSRFERGLAAFAGHPAGYRHRSKGSGRCAERYAIQCFRICSQLQVGDARYGLGWHDVFHGSDQLRCMPSRDPAI